MGSIFGFVKQVNENKDSDPKEVFMSGSSKTMQFGVTLPTYPKGASIEGVLSVIHAAEEMGFTSAWTTDHVILPKDEAGPYESIFEPLMTLA